MLIYKRVETIKNMGDLWHCFTNIKGTYAGNQDFVHMIFLSDVGLSSKYFFQPILRITFKRRTSINQIEQVWTYQVLHAIGIGVVWLGHAETIQTLERLY